MPVWEIYTNLTASDFRALVAVTAQVLLESDVGATEFSSDLLQQSTKTSAKEIESLLVQTGPTTTRQKVQEMLENEALAARACRAVLDQVRGYPKLAERVAREYEARKQKMTGVEVVLLAGALVILAMRIKHIRWGQSGAAIDFEPANEAVKTFITGLVKGIGLGPS
jgi:hypothetical protein